VTFETDAPPDFSDLLTLFPFLVAVPLTDPALPDNLSQVRPNTPPYWIDVFATTYEFAIGFT